MGKLAKAPEGHRLAGLGGFVPPKTICPFISKCKPEEDCPAGAKGEEHESYFSCALARLIDSIEESENGSGK